MKAKSPFISLRTKIVAGTILALVLIMSAFFFLLLSFHRRQKLNEFQVFTTRLSELMEVGLEHGMLRNDLEIVKEMVERLSHHEGVEKIVIVNKKGEVKISSNGQSGQVLDQGDPTCQLCHRYLPENRSKTVVFSGEKGERFFRTVKPILNKPKCYGCHNPTDKVNGVLIADFSMASFDKEMLASIKTMGVSIFITVIGMSLVIGLLINRLVLKRLGKFSRLTRLVSNGDLNQVVEVTGKDEIGELARSFNSMTINLRDSLAEISKNKEYLENLINSIEDEIMVIDRDFRVVTANDSLLSRVEKKKGEVLGRKCYEVAYRSLDPCALSHMACPAQETFEMGRSSQAIHVYPLEEEERQVEIHASPVRDEKGQVYQVVEVFRDITERKKLEERLVQSERLISLGKLAASVAHEINNPLTGILTYIKLMLMRLEKHPLPIPSLEDFKVYLTTIGEETARCGRIVLGLLDFSRQSEYNPRPVDVNEIVNKSLQLLDHKIKHEEIKVVKELTPALVIQGDFNQLQQVFINIILNATQAIPNKGVVRVKTQPSPNERFAEIRIEDTGCGIPREHLKKVFDPFFTTKDGGKGLGLGLSVAYGIVARHGGSIRVDSKVGEGSVFTVQLPLASMPAGMGKNEGKGK